MAIQRIETRIKASPRAFVERIHEGDATSETLAAFEYSHQADIFAKAVSKGKPGVFAVRLFNSVYAMDVYENGKRIKPGQTHWSNNLLWSPNAN